MAVLSPRDLKETASQRLSQASFDPKTLILIHTGLIVVLNLIINGLNLYLSEQIGTTGGLSGLGLRSVLQTAQTVLGYFSALFTPFWTAGLLYAMVCIVRGREAGPRNLLQGFRRFGSILSYSLWQMTFLMILCIALFYVLTLIYLLLPTGSGFMAQMEELMKDPNLFLADGSLNMEIVPVDAMFPSLIPLMILFAAVAIPLIVYLSYHFRLGSFLLVESIYRGAIGAFLVSAKLMKGHKMQMFKLDLSFWWYYLLESLLMIVLYLDLIFATVGIVLPFHSTVAFFLTIALYGVLQLGLHWWKKAEVDATYALAYETILREVLPEDAVPNE